MDGRLVQNNLFLSFGLSIPKFVEHQGLSRHQLKEVFESPIVLPHLILDRLLKVFDSQLLIEISHICVSLSYGISEQDRQNSCSQDQRCFHSIVQARLTAISIILLTYGTCPQVKWGSARLTNLPVRN